MNLSEVEILTFIAGSILTSLLLLVGHWFPYVQELSRIQAYIYGVTSILLGFSVWRVLAGDWITVIGLAILCAFAVATVGGAYAIDYITLRLRQARRGEYATQRFKELEKDS